MEPTDDQLSANARICHIVASNPLFGWRYGRAMRLDAGILHSSSLPIR
jgi:hypothetical protein